MMGCKPYQTRFEPKNLRVSATGLLPTHQIQEGEDNKEVNQVNSTSFPSCGYHAPIIGWRWLEQASRLCFMPSSSCYYPAIVPSFFHSFPAMINSLNE